ncbi:MAG TPA: TMEM165/GDT1 family protein [Vicinamibacterales bacterium]
MIQLVLATYGAVFVAEIVGDKLLYTTSVLAARYRSASVVLGMALAFMCKMAVAVAVGAAITQLPRWLVATFTAASFIGVAIAVWRKPDVRAPKAKDSTVFSGATVAFAAIFFSEWGDVGQVTAAGMAAKYVWSAQASATASTLWTTAILVWLGAVAAMVTKGALAGLLGEGVRRWIADRVEPRVIRYVATAALLVLGILAVLETLGVLVD